MSITSAKTGATGISLALDNNYMEPIASIPVTSTSVSTLRFTDIPQNYKHLQIRYMVRRSDATVTNGLGWNFNNDNGVATYAQSELGGDGASTYVSTSPNRDYSNPDYVAGNSALANTYGVGIVDIFDYTNTTKYKTYRVLSGVDMNGTGGIIALGTGLWMKTDPITTISFGMGANFMLYSRISLYGIKG